MRAKKYVVLPEEDGAEFAELEAALVRELAPVGALQRVLARRVAVAAWRLSCAPTGWSPERGWGPVPQPGGQQVEVFAERSWGADSNPGLGLIRDGNGTRSFETLMRYRGAAMAEFWRALRTLKALQAEQAAGARVLEMPPRQPRAPARLASRPVPDEPERRALNEYVIPDQPGPGRTLHEPAACWMPNEPEPGRDRRRVAAAFSTHSSCG